MKRLLPLIAFTLALPLRAQDNCPVVDFGDNLFWYNIGIPPYRQGTSKLVKEKLAEGEFITGHPFSETDPLSMVTGDYNTRGNNTRFYGGLKVHCWDNPTNLNSWTEGGCNVDHEGFDDLNFMGYALVSPDSPEKPGSRLNAVGLWFWKKEDFLNGGDKFPVTFNDSSRVGVLLSRTYRNRTFKDTYAEKQVAVVPKEKWGQWETLHLVVRDGAQFFIAETAFDPQPQTLFEVSPRKVKWAKFDPKALWDFEFHATKATFQEHEFKDVTAAGWMIFKNKIENAALWLKWYGFGMDAVVNRPWEASANIPMVKLSGPSGKDGLYMAKTEVTYEQWRKVFKWAQRNQYAMHAPFDFDRDGNMGSMLADSAAHSPDEPATGMTWYDAVLWCNALSEYEGQEPCYYEDATFTKPLHIGKNQSSIEASLVPPKVYTKWNASGFRLPTPAEWTSAVDTGEKAPAASTQTAKAGAAPANSKGFHDLLGNVWEYVWDIPGNAVEAPGSHTVLGGDFRGPSPKALPAGEVPSRGHYAVGFRPVRRVGPGDAPAPASLAAKPGFWQFGNVPAWTYQWEEVLASSATPSQLAPEIPMVAMDDIEAGKTEVSYAQWKPVFLWAEAHGYRFARDGDMGSMGWMSNTHSQDEPVTTIGLLDAAVWCNALSEMKGLKPCYYEDAAFTKPLRTVNPFRVNSYQWALKSARFGNRDNPFSRFLFHYDPAANGYRLPFTPEWQKLAGAGLYPSGPTLDPDSAWFSENSGERTHPVGKTAATGNGFHDLSGNVFEWAIENAKTPKPEVGNLFSVRVHGGSFRTDTQSTKALTTTPSMGAWEWIASGTATPEIGFRVVRKK